MKLTQMVVKQLFEGSHVKWFNKSRVD